MFYMRLKWLPLGFILRMALELFGAAAFAVSGKNLSKISIKHIFTIIHIVAVHHVVLHCYPCLCKWCEPPSVVLWAEAAVFWVIHTLSPSAFSLSWLSADQLPALEPLPPCFGSSPALAEDQPRTVSVGRLSSG